MVKRVSARQRLANRDNAIKRVSKMSQAEQREMTAAALRARDEQILTQIDPDNLLPEDERAQRLAEAKTEWMRGLARQAAAARTARAQADREARLAALVEAAAAEKAATS